MNLHWLDSLIPLTYLVAIVLVARASSRRVKTPEDLFLASRGLGFGIIGLSLFASNISSTTLIGLSGAAYSSGIAVANYEWMAAVVMVFAAIFLIPVYLRNHCRTVPEMPWTGLLVGVPILGLYYWSMNHYISQRFFAARSEDHARWGAILASRSGYRKPQSG